MCQCVIKVNQFPDHTKLICVLLVLNIFAKILIFAKIFAKMIRKFRENDNENGRNFAKINYFRMSFENFAKEIFENLETLIVCKTREIHKFRIHGIMDFT